MWPFESSQAAGRKVQCVLRASLKLQRKHQCHPSSIQLANMSVATTDPIVGHAAASKSRSLFKVVILCFIAAAAISSRLFSVIRKSSSLARSSRGQRALRPVQNANRPPLSRIREHYPRVYVVDAGSPRAKPEN